MLQHQHIILTLIFLYPLLDHSSPISLLISISILMIFSVLPDIDLSGKKFTNAGMNFPSFLKRYLRSLSLITQIIRTFVFIPYDFVVRLLTGRSETGHRESSHSVIFGIVTILVLFVVITFILSIINLRISIPYYYIYLALLSFLIHLYLDSITVNGIKWFYPLNILEIKGKINTSNWLHMRIVDLYILLIFLLIINLVIVENTSIDLPPLLIQIAELWTWIFPAHTYLLSIPLALAIREVKLSL